MARGEHAAKSLKPSDSAAAPPGLDLRRCVPVTGQQLVTVSVGTEFWALPRKSSTAVRHETAIRPGTDHRTWRTIAGSDPQKSITIVGPSRPPRRPRGQARSLIALGQATTSMVLTRRSCQACGRWPGSRWPVVLFAAALTMISNLAESGLK